MSADASWAVHKCFEVSSLLSERSGIEVHWECHRSWLFLVLTNAGQRSDLLSGTCSAHAHAAGQLGIPMTLCAEVSVLVERHIYHVLGGQFYSKTKPEWCYATEAEA